MRWQYASGSELLLPTFATRRGWTEIVADGSTTHLDGWFEPPSDGDVTFLLKLDAISALHWSGNETALPLEELAVNPSAASGRQWPSNDDFGGSAVSRAVSVRFGQRYYLRLTCTAGPEPCAVGARLHTGLSPDRASVKHRRLAPRSTGSAWRLKRCSRITDRAECCATIDRYGDPCVASTSTFSNGRVCMNAQWVAEYAPDAAGQSACGSRYDSAMQSAPAREKLPDAASCDSLEDRVACCRAIDGRTQAYYANQPCIPAQVCVHVHIP